MQHYEIEYNNYISLQEVSQNLSDVLRFECVSLMTTVCQAIKTAANETYTMNGHDMNADKFVSPHSRQTSNEIEIETENDVHDNCIPFTQLLNNISSNYSTNSNCNDNDIDTVQFSPRKHRDRYKESNTDNKENTENGGNREKECLEYEKIETDEKENHDRSAANSYMNQLNCVREVSSRSADIQMGLLRNIQILNQKSHISQDLDEEDMAFNILNAIEPLASRALYHGSFNECTKGVVNEFEVDMGLLASLQSRHTTSIVGDR